MVGFLNWRSQKFSQQLFFVKNYYLNLNFFQALQTALFKNETKNLLKKDASLTVDIARDSKTLKKRARKAKNEKKSKNSFFTFAFLYRKTYFCQKTYLQKLSFILLHLHCRFFTCLVIGNAVTPMPIQIFIGFVDAIFQSKILGNRLGILTQILIEMDCFFIYIFQTSPLNLGKEKYINLGNQFHYKKYNERDRNISKTLNF